MFKKNIASNEKRSPLKNEPLRQAGQSLDERIFEIFYDKVLWPAIIIFVIFVMVVFEWAKKYNETPPQPVFWSIVFVIVCLFFIIKNYKYIKEVRNLRLGRDGERTVGGFLEELREKGYKVFHDVVDEGFNIDHIIVGPGGVFTIETKTWRKNIQGNQKISYDGSKIKIAGVTYKKDPIAQAKNQMYWLEGFIERNCKMNIKVKPVIIFPDWYIEPILKDAEVWVLNQKLLESFLEQRETSLNAEQINLISSHVESYNRN